MTLIAVQRGAKHRAVLVDQFRTHALGQEDMPWYLRHNAADAWAATIRNRTAPGQHARFRNSADDANVMEITDNGVEINGDFTVNGTFNAPEGGPIFNVVAYGADPTGVVDATAAIQAAVAAMPSRGGALYFPAGLYTINAPITVAKSMRVFGDGRAVSTIQSSSTSTSIFIVTVIYPNGQVYFHDLGFTRTTTPSVSGAAIAFDPPTDTTDVFWSPRIERCQFFFHFVGLDLLNTSHATVTGCTFSNIVGDSILFHAATSPAVGFGDHFVFNNVFTNTANAGTVGIGIVSGAGFDIGSNKFLGFERQIYVKTDTSSINDSNLWIHNNSMEGAGETANCIALSDFGAPTPFPHVMINDNEIAPGPGSIAAAAVAIGANYANIQIQDNEIIGYDAQTDGIVLDGCDEVWIEGNTVRIAGSTAFANLSATNCRRGLNEVTGTGTLQSGTWDYIEPRKQFKTVAMTATNAGLGNLFKGPASAAQSWPEAFFVTPHTIVAQGITEGALQAVIDSSSASQFTAHAVGAATGTAYTFTFMGLSDG